MRLAAAYRRGNLAGVDFVPAALMVPLPLAESAMTLIVHHLENSRSQRILWMLEELGLPYEIKRYERNTKTMLAPPELKRRSIRSASRR